MRKIKEIQFKLGVLRNAISLLHTEAENRGATYELTYAVHKLEELEWKLEAEFINSSRVCPNCGCVNFYSNGDPKLPGTKSICITCLEIIEEVI